MQEFFTRDYTGGAFELFGPGHILWLALATVGGIVLIRAGRGADADGRRRLRRSFAVLLLANEFGRHLWALSQGSWTIQADLPLQMCGAMVWVTAFAFLFDVRRAFPFVYFFGIAGALQGVLTPDAGIYGLPHYVAIETLASHSSLVIGGLWVVLVEGFRPTFRHFWVIFGGLNLAALGMYFLNSALGSNYLFVNAKPPNASIVDLMPEWPWYILVLEIIAFAMFFALYLPFRRRETAASPAG